MMTRGHFHLGIALALAGCVQPGQQRPSASDLPPVPHIEPVMEGLIDEKPIWESQPVTANAVTVDQQLYIVKIGDTLRAVGETTRVGSETIARANMLTAPFSIKAGQVLRIPAGRYHRVGIGHTGIAIARAYGIPWRQIVVANDLVEPFILRVGRHLRLPGSAIPNPEARAAAFHVDIDDLDTGGAPARIITSATAALRFAGRFSWPHPGVVDEPFGRAGRGRMNRGIEITAPFGSDIRAAADGTVAFVGNGGSAGYGGLILVRHGDGWISVYGRVAQATVATGQAVRSGQAIGRMGNDATLHFELRKDRAAVDPVKYLPKR